MAVPRRQTYERVITESNFRDCPFNFNASWQVGKDTPKILWEMPARFQATGRGQTGSTKGKEVSL